jgi:hypothetical protein
MSAYLMMTAILFRRGSAESRNPDNPVRADDQVSKATRKRRPILSWFYSCSLGISLALLFIISFALHWWTSLARANEEALGHGGEAKSPSAYLLDTELWLSPSRIGSPNSCRQQSWSCCRFACAIRAHLNQSLSKRQTPNRGLARQRVPMRWRSDDTGNGRGYAR